MTNQPTASGAKTQDQETMHAGIGGCAPVQAPRIESEGPTPDPVRLPGSTGAWQSDRNGTDRRRRRRARTQAAGTALAVCALLDLSCKKLMPDRATLEAFNIVDRAPAPPPAPPPRYTVDIIVDTASPAGVKQNVAEVVASTVDFVETQDPRSEIRLWTLDDHDGQLLKDSAHDGHPGAVAQPNSSQRSGDATLRVEHLLTALSTAALTSRSPIAEAITKVSLSPPADRSHWLIVVVSDGIEESGSCPATWYPAAPAAAPAPALRPIPPAPAAAPGAPTCEVQFSCQPPDPVTWLKYIADHRLLPPDTLKGAIVTFAYFEPTTGRSAAYDTSCLSSMAYVQALQDLWRGVLTERTGAKVQFSLRTPAFPTTDSAAVLSAVATKEAQ